MAALIGVSIHWDHDADCMEIDVPVSIGRSCVTAGIAGNAGAGKQVAEPGKSGGSFYITHTGGGPHGNRKQD
jgi:hypothetical protein